TLRNALFVLGPVTVHGYEPVFAAPIAMVSNGPPAPERDRYRSTFVTPLPGPPPSVAFQVRFGVVAWISTSPPFGESTATLGSSRSPRNSLPRPQSLLHTTPVIASRVACAARYCFTNAGPTGPNFWMSIAAAPVTCGAAMLAP